MPERARPLNFLVFITDQHPWDWLGCAGHPAVQTPHIDALAAAGVRFARCYTNHPLCMPTRATWLTGQTPRGHGVRCNGIPLRRDLPTIAEALRRAGYATSSLGKIHLTPFSPPRGGDANALDPTAWPECHDLWKAGRIDRVPTPYYGFEQVDWLGASGVSCSSNYSQWLLDREPDGMRLMRREASTPFGAGPETVWPMALPTELHFTSWLAERAEQVLEQRAADGRPFFLLWSSPDPHPPYAAPRPWCDMYDPRAMPPPRRRAGEIDERPPHYRQFFERGGKSAGRFAPTNVPDEYTYAVRAMVAAMISQADAAIGRVMRALDRSGLRENTAVVFMSDHGQMLGDHWLFNMPPTALDSLTRVPSIWSLPGGGRGVVSEALASHLDFAPTVLDLAGVAPLEGDVPPEVEAPENLPVLRGHSLAPVLRGERPLAQESVIIENDEDYLGLRLRTLVTRDWHLTTYAGRPYGELHDLRNDPDQLYNLWDDPDRRAVRTDLQAQLGDKLAQTDAVIPRRLCHA